MVWVAVAAAVVVVSIIINKFVR